MLFDLTGRGRRRTVQVIYLGLAVLLGVGLVGLGIGGSNVGLFGNDNGSSGGGSSTGSINKDVRAAEKMAQARPNDSAALANLVRQRLQLSNDGKNYDQNRKTWTPAGKAELMRVDQAWQRYLALNPPNLDSSLATLMANAYGPSGLNDASKATGTYEALAAADPKNPLAYANLADAAYAAKQVRKGDLAAQRAVALSPPNTRKLIKQRLAQDKVQALAPGAGAGASAPPGGGAGAAPPSGGGGTVRPAPGP